MEGLSLLGIIIATATASNFHGTLTTWLLPWWQFDPAKLGLVCFLGLLLIGTLLTRVVVRRVSQAATGERLHWTIQAVGLVFGVTRGLWWAGLVTLLLISLGIPYLEESVQKRSVLGPRLTQAATSGLTTVADYFPGAGGRTTLVPAVVIHLPSLPKANEKDNWL